MLEGYFLEVALTTVNSCAQAWYGFDQGIISGILISTDFIDTFPQTKNSNIQGITSSCFSLGNLAGCLAAFFYGTKLGRKWTLRVGALISAIGAILQFSATTFPQLIVGRVINGVGNGMISSTCGIFQAESSRGERRGKLSVIVVLHNVIFYCSPTILDSLKLGVRPEAMGRFRTRENRGLRSETDLTPITGIADHISIKQSTISTSMLGSR